MLRRRVTALVLAVLGSAVLLACEADEPATSERPDASAPTALPAWRTSDAAVDTSGLPWAAGTTIHLADGTTIDAGAPVRHFVVAGDGAYVVNRGDDGYQLVLVAPGQPPVGTGLVVSSPDYLAASPDGRHLAVLDRGRGEEDRFGTPQATVVVFDLATGEQLESTYGFGDPATDDFADAYSESEIEISAMTDTDLWVRGYDDLVIDLVTGEAEEHSATVPERVPTEALEREQRRIRDAAEPARVVFPAWATTR